MSKSPQPEESETQDNLIEYLRGRRVSVKMYDLPEHPEYEKGMQGTMTEFLHNLVKVSIDARGHVKYPFVIGVRLDNTISQWNYESEALMESRDLILILYDVQVLRDLVQKRRNTMCEFSAFIPISRKQSDTSQSELTNLVGFSQEVDIELLD